MSGHVYYRQLAKLLTHWGGGHVYQRPFCQSRVIPLYQSHVVFILSENHRLQSAYENHLIAKLVIVSTAYENHLIAKLVIVSTAKLVS